MEDDNQSSPDMEIRLVSRDGKEFTLPYSGAKLSKLVENALDGKGDDADVEERTVQIPKVEEECLSKVVEYLKHYQEEPMDEIRTPLEENTFEGNIKQQWYREFLEGMDDPLLFELVTAANFMEIQPLLDICCLKVSSLLMGKSAEEIRSFLNIPKMTPEEEAEAREKHRWIFDD
ncbi:hypothetical protein ACHAXS_005463 [Conticribra weissflogii]